MFVTLRSQLALHLQAALFSIRNLYYKPLSLVFTSLVIAITLSVPISFWVLSQAIQDTLHQWQQSSPIAIYFKMDASPETITNTWHIIKKDKDVALTTFIPPEQGLKILATQAPIKDLTRYLPTNPLPTLIEVTPHTDIYNMPSYLNKICERFRSLPGVDLVELNTAWINQLHHTSHFAQILVQGMMSLLLLAIFCIIGYTLRLTFYQRFDEIQILKLLGAKNAYIIRPFLYTGIGYGLLAGIGSMICVNILLFSLHQALKQMTFISLPMTLSITQSYYILIIAMSLGWIAAQITLRQALAQIFPTHNDKS